MALVACTQEIPAPEVIDNTDDVVVKMVEIEFSANLENPTDPDSKATINLSDGTASWHDGTDQIAIHTHNGSLATLTYNESSNSFKGSIPDGDSIDDNATAYYPASIAISGDAAHVNLPNSYETADLAAQSFPLRGLVNTSTNSIEFKYLGSMLKITATYMRDEIDQVEINLPLNITGTLPVAGTDDAPSVTPASGSSTITIGVGSLARTSGTGEATFLFPILAGDYAGFSVTFKSSTLGVFGQKSTSKVQSFARRKVYSMTSFSVPGYYASQAFKYNDVTYNNANTYAFFKINEDADWYISKAIPTDTYANSRFYIIVNGAIATPDDATDAKSTIVYGATKSDKPNVTIGSEISPSTKTKRYGTTPFNLSAADKAYGSKIDILFNPKTQKVIFANSGVSTDFRTIYITTDLGLPDQQYFMHLWGAKAVTNWSRLPGSSKVTISGIDYYAFSFLKSEVINGQYKFIFLRNTDGTLRYDFQKEDTYYITVSDAEDDYYVFFTSTTKSGNTDSNANESWQYTNPAVPSGTSKYKININGTDGSNFAWNSGYLVVSDASITAGEGILLNFNGSATDLYGMENSGEVLTPDTWYEVINSPSANAFSVGTTGDYDIYFDVYNEKVKIVSKP